MNLVTNARRFDNIKKEKKTGENKKFGVYYFFNVFIFFKSFSLGLPQREFAIIFPLLLFFFLNLISLFSRNSLVNDKIITVESTLTEILTRKLRLRNCYLNNKCKI